MRSVAEDGDGDQGRIAVTVTVTGLSAGSVAGRVAGLTAALAVTDAVVEGLQCDRSRHSVTNKVTLRRGADR